MKGCVSENEMFPCQGKLCNGEHSYRAIPAPIVVLNWNIFVSKIQIFCPDSWHHWKFNNQTCLTIQIPDMFGIQIPTVNVLVYAVKRTSLPGWPSSSCYFSRRSFSMVVAAGAASITPEIAAFTSRWISEKKTKRTLMLSCHRRLHVLQIAKASVFNNAFNVQIIQCKVAKSGTTLSINIVKIPNLYIFLLCTHLYKRKQKNATSNNLRIY